MEERFDYDGLLEVNAVLREQNRVLDGALRLVLESWVNGRKVRDGIGAAVLVTVQAALTATSQPAQEQCSYCKRPLTDNHSFSYGVPGVPRVYKCDRADCTKPATSQEGEHESR